MSLTVARVSIIVFFFFVLASFSPVFGITTPSFPSCVNPQGNIKVEYSSGTHGIVGDTSTYTGSDTVYSLSNETLFQCFCPDNGKGIQTNWWKSPGVSDKEKKDLENQGWIYVPNGLAWGLADSSYFAKNQSYVCKGGIGGGEILGLSTNTLASTGSMQLILKVLGIGLLSFILAKILKKASNS